MFPLNCCDITGPVEPYFLGICLTKPLLESFTVMLCPEATKDVFNLEFSVIGAVGLVAVIMIFSRIFSVFLCCAIHQNCSKSYKPKNCCSIDVFFLIDTAVCTEGHEEGDIS